MGSDVEEEVWSAIEIWQELPMTMTMTSNAKLSRTLKNKINTLCSEVTCSDASYGVEERQAQDMKARRALHNMHDDRIKIR